MTREEFMETVYDELHSDGDNNRANRIIDAADEYAEPRWIPVSERLPDKDKYNHGSVWERSVLVTAYFKWDDTKHTFIDMRLAEDVINNNFINECIIAWMPLPKCYELQESEVNNGKSRSNLSVS